MKAKKSPRLELAAPLVLFAAFGAAFLVAQDAPPVPASPITLQEAIHRAQASEPTYAAAVAGAGTARLDRAMAKTALLPTVQFHNQGLYTQPNGLSNQAGQGTGNQPSPRFVANNAVREYASQGVVNESLGLAQVADIRRASAASLRAAAEAEIARRGLVVAVTGLYFGVEASEKRVAIAEQAHQEAADFLRLTGNREQAREAAHADVLKAELEEQQRTRELSDARVEAEKARLELGVLLFPDPRTPYTLATPEDSSPLASRAEVEQAAAKNNPELKQALAALRESDAEVLAARAAYLPSLGLNYTYGIDAPQFAAKGPDNAQNLGYSASVTLDIPVWDWLATERKLKQSKIQRDVARVSLSSAQREAISRLNEAFAEAEAARDQLASLDASVTTAAESLRLTRMRYTAGECTVLEVVDAQSSNVTAQNAREDGYVRYQTALAHLQTMTGTM